MNYIKNKIANTYARIVNTSHGTHPFKLSMSLQSRGLLYEKLQIDYPEKIPIIVHGVNITMSKTKFLVEPTMTVQGLIDQIFDHIEDSMLLPDEKDILLQTSNGSTMKIQDNLGNIYTNYKDSEDNLLYIWILIQ